MGKTRRFIRKAFGLVEVNEEFPAPPGPQEHAENVEFMVEALESGRGIPISTLTMLRSKGGPRTLFDEIGPDGKLTDAGWARVGLENPHKKKRKRNGEEGEAEGGPASDA